MAMWLRGSEKARSTTGRKLLAPSTMAGSISIVSTDSSESLSRRVAVVRPDPNPIAAAVLAWGWYDMGSVARRTIVGSSWEGGWDWSIWIDASGLPFVRILVPPASRNTLTVAVFPSW